MPTYTTTINHLRIMKNYAVSVDITMSKTIYIDAENEESAKTIASNWIADDPFYYIMNKTRRKWLEKTIATLEDQKLELESICEEEQEAYDNMPESLQESEKGQTMYENIDTLESASSDLEDIISNLEEILER